MRDNIRLISSQRDSKAGKHKGEPFFTSGGEYFTGRRFDFEFSGGSRRSIPYYHIHAMTYFPPDPNATPSFETITVESPTMSRLTVDGYNLKPIYEALRNETLEWMREADSDEEYIGEGTFITRLSHILFYDWQVDLEYIEQARERIGEPRHFPDFRPPTSD